MITFHSEKLLESFVVDFFLKGGARLVYGISGFHSKGQVACVSMVTNGDLSKLTY